MQPEDEYFVSTCSHVNEGEETDAAGERRARLLRTMREDGTRIKVALLDAKPVAFLYVLPIEHSPWGPHGRDLAFVPCLFVPEAVKDRGIGEALVAEAEKEARTQGRKGIATYAYYGGSWFMPAAYFEKLGFVAAARKGDAAILWKAFDASAEAPRFLLRNYGFEPVPGKVVVDLFYNEFCLTSGTEARRVREVAGEFGDRVLLNEHDAGDPEALARHGVVRAIFVNGKEIGWGYDAPREGIREAIETAFRGA
jgi:predicted N-acetyltransferase YhbS